MSKPDLILLDVMMPDGDGFEVVRKMRAGGPPVPVIFLTIRNTLCDHRQAQMCSPVGSRGRPRRRTWS
jgi:CheY-like chemotaxis protein